MIMYSFGQINEVRGSFREACAGAARDQPLASFFCPAEYIKYKIKGLQDSFTSHNIGLICKSDLYYKYNSINANGLKVVIKADNRCIRDPPICGIIPLEADIFSSGK